MRVRRGDLVVVELDPTEGSECALGEDSVAICSLILTTSIEHRVLENLGSVPDDRLDEVDRALEYSLGLRHV